LRAWTATSPGGYTGAMSGWDAELDARGLLCPLPVLKARKRLKALASGSILRVVADDPAALVDIPHFCSEAGHSLVGQRDLGHPAYEYLIRKGG
jgi:tRNA 2-thiouridine synthesizing protein A